MSETPLSTKLRRSPFLIAAAFAFILFSPSNSAATLFEFDLGNHPDGGVAPPFYGLRLDELFNVTSNKDWFTFDFEAPGTDVRLVYDDGGTPDNFNDDNVHIFGTAFGGRDIGSGYDPDFSGFIQVNFNYTTNFLDPGFGPGIVAVEVSPDNPANNGTVTLGAGWGANQGLVVPLVDEDGTHPFSFRFNNQEDHRLAGTGLEGTGTYVGWGWLNHSGGPHIKATDWLFIGTPRTRDVPAPGTLAVLGLGLLGLAIARRHRN